MCNSHLSIAVPAVLLVLSLHWDILASGLIICLAGHTEAGGLFFFFLRNLAGHDGSLHLTMLVI